MTSRLTTVLATLGASGALVAGGLAFGGSAASAVDANPLAPTVTYTCSGSLLGVGTLAPFAVPVTYDLSQLAPIALAPIASGSTIKSLPLSSSADITNFVTAAQGAIGPLVQSGSLTAVSGTVKSFALTVGQQSFPMAMKPASLSASDLVATPPPALPVSGDIAKPEMVLLPAGTYSAMLPKTFGFDVGATIGGAATDLGTLACTDSSANSATERTIAVPLNVTGNPPKPVLTAKAPKTVKVKKGTAAATITASVKNTLGGKVTAKLGKKTYSSTLKNGVAKVVVKGIKKGVNKIVVSFPKAASKTLKVTGK